MDLSKLPKFSETQQPPRNDAADVPTPQPPPPGYALTEVPTGGPEAWISIAFGAIMLLMFPRFLQWASSRIFGTHFNEFVRPDGTVVPYQNVPEFWMDLGPVLFGLVLILEGLVFAFSRSRKLLLLAFVLTVIATAYNLVYLVLTLNRGLALISALAVAFGVYIAWWQWRLIQITSPRRETGYA